MENGNINKEYARSINDRERERFVKVPYKNRMLFLSHCIRAELRDELHRFAEGLGYKVHVVGGGSIVHKIIMEEKPEAVLGIACEPELTMAVEKLELPLHVVLLDIDGCKDTTVNVEEAKRVISLCEKGGELDSKEKSDKS
jgi:hypothetical protein